MGKTLQPNVYMREAAIIIGRKRERKRAVKDNCAKAAMEKTGRTLNNDRSAREIKKQRVRRFTFNGVKMSLVANPRVAETQTTLELELGFHAD